MPPDNPRIEVPATTNPCYVSDAFVEAPGKMFWESPGRERRSGALRPLMQFCFITSRKQTAGVHPPDAGFPTPTVESFPDDTIRAYIQNIARYRRFDSNGFYDDGTFPTNPTHRNTLSHISTVNSNNVPSLSGDWTITSFNPGTNDGSIPNGIVTEISRMWCRGKGYDSYSADSHVYTAEDLTSFTLEGYRAGSTCLRVTAAFSDFNIGIDEWTIAKADVESFDLSTLQFSVNAGQPVGQQREITHRDYRHGLSLGPLPRYNGTVTSTYDPVLNNYTSLAAGYSTTDFSAYDGAAVLSNPIFTGFTNTQILLGWTDGMQAHRAKIRFPPTDPVATRDIILMQEDRLFGQNTSTLTVLGRVTIQRGQEYVYPGQMPPFGQYYAWRWIMAVLA